MINIARQQYCIDIMNYSDAYIQKLKQGMFKSSACVDTSYVRDVLSDLGSFSALVRMECLNDMTLLHQDIAYAKNMQESYENFADYCYDMLKQAYGASNECLSQSNQLFYKLQSELQLEHVDISIASGYIAFNLFGHGATLELMNFKRMTGIGLCYDLCMKQPTIVTSNVQEQLSPRLTCNIELAEVLQQLQSGGEVYKAIDAWSAIVNDKLQDAKRNAMPAWCATYNAYKADWFNVEFSKQNASTFCILTLTAKRLNETVCKLGKVRRLDYGLDFMKVLQLDYINNGNFNFD